MYRKLAKWHGSTHDNHIVQKNFTNWAGVDISRSTNPITEKIQSALQIIRSIIERSFGIFK